MSALSRLCHRIVWLDKGEMVREGEPEPVIAAYEEASLRGQYRDARSGEKAGRHVNVDAEIASVRLLNASGGEIGAAPALEDVAVRIRLKIRKPGVAVRGVVDVHAKGVFLFRATQPAEVVTERRGIVDLLMRIPAHLLAETTYLLNVTVYTRHDKESKLVLDNALTFLAYGTDAAPLTGGFRSGGRGGVIAPRVDWDAQTHVHTPRPKTYA
jgi:hypothetical protein